MDWLAFKYWTKIPRIFHFEYFFKTHIKLICSITFYMCMYLSELPSKEQLMILIWFYKYLKIVAIPMIESAPKTNTFWALYTQRGPPENTNQKRTLRPFMGELCLMKLTLLVHPKTHHKNFKGEQTTIIFISFCEAISYINIKRIVKSIWYLKSWVSSTIKAPKKLRFFFIK